MRRVKDNIFSISDGPFEFRMTIGPRTKRNRPSLYDNRGWFVDYLSLNGNSKQRRQQQRKLIRDLNK